MDERNDWCLRAEPITEDYAIVVISYDGQITMRVEDFDKILAMLRSAQKDAAKQADRHSEYFGPG